MLKPVFFIVFVLFGNIVLLHVHANKLLESWIQFQGMILFTQHNIYWSIWSHSYEITLKFSTTLPYGPTTFWLSTVWSPYIHIIFYENHYFRNDKKLGDMTDGCLDYLLFTIHSLLHAVFIQMTEVLSRISLNIDRLNKWSPKFW